MSLVGNLEDLGLGDILQIVSLSRKSGVLHLRGEADADVRQPEGEIIFQNGQVIRATSTEATQNLGELLLARGVVTDAQLKEALALQRVSGSRDRLGNLLIRHLGVPTEKIQETIRHQIEAIVFSFFQWPRGDFSFELKETDGAIDKVDMELRHLVLDSGLNPQFLAMEGTRLNDEQRVGRAANPAVRPVPSRSPGRPASTVGPLAARPTPSANGGPPGAPAAAPLPGPARSAAPAPIRPAASRASGPGAGSTGGTIDLTRELGLGEAGSGYPPDRAAPGLSAGYPGGVASRGLDMLKAMISELMSPEAHGQITLLVLRFAAELMRRAVLFLVKEDEVAGLGQFGLELPSDVPDRVVRSIRIPLAEPSVFAEVLRRRTPFKGPLGGGRWDAYLVEKLGGHRPVEAFCAPIVSGATVAAMLYADNVPDDTPIGDTESLEIFLYQAGLQMEKALLERKIRELNGPGQ